MWSTTMIGLVLVLLYYHMSEVIMVLVWNKEELEWDSLLVTKPYLIAMTAGLIEYHVEWYLFPQFKAMIAGPCLFIGLCITFFGDSIRKLGMSTARRAFTHRIKEQRRPDHVLVKHGIYAYCRHPGYLGWTIWSAGTQVMLGNPVCFIAFYLASFSFFSKRIPYEEYYLEQMFGKEFVEYRQRTPTLIPGIP
mmetsp:Transcript_18141/g.31469  ORF Transcript_18141/g.31469 Transcript_18141/m.31469 type:complete len:192 (-) Transcript_18141:76-651(-)